MTTYTLPKSAEVVETPPPKLLDRVRDRIRRLGYSRRTELSYVAWIKRFIVFHGKRMDDAARGRVILISMARDSLCSMRQAMALDFVHGAVHDNSSGMGIEEFLRA